MYIIVAIVIIEIFIYFYASFYCENIFSLVLSILVMLVLGTSFAYSRFVVDEFTVKNLKKKIPKKTQEKKRNKKTKKNPPKQNKKETKKMYCFYRINLLECVLGVRFEVVSN